MLSQWDNKHFSALPRSSTSRSEGQETVSHRFRRENIEIFVWFGVWDVKGMVLFS
jgi:hypothetical protein